MYGKSYEIWIWSYPHLRTTPYGFGCLNFPSISWVSQLQAAHLYKSVQVGASWNGSGENPWMRLKHTKTTSKCIHLWCLTTSGKRNERWVSTNWLFQSILFGIGPLAASAHASHPIVSRLLAKASTPYNLEAQDRVMQSRPGRLTCWRV